MAPVAGRPFLAWILDRLAQARVRARRAGGGLPPRGHRAALRPRLPGHGAALFGRGRSRWAPAAPSGWRRTASATGRSSCSTATPSWTSTTGRCSPRTMRGREQMSMAVCQVRRRRPLRRARACTDGHVAASWRRGRAGPGVINAGTYLLSRRRPGADPARRCRSRSSSNCSCPRSARIRPAAFVTEGLFIDIGVPEDYARAQQLFALRQRRGHDAAAGAQGAVPGPRRRHQRRQELRPPHRGLRVPAGHLRAVRRAPRRAATCSSSSPTRRASAAASTPKPTSSA